MKMTYFIQHADRFAETAHASVGQVRKYTGEPYIVHPRSVANILQTTATFYTEEMVAAALLHDVVEDTDVTHRQVKDEFGFQVAELVYWLTDAATRENNSGNRATRVRLNAEHIGIAPNDAKTIKACDVMDNIASIVEHDVRFALAYIPEKLILRPYLEGADLAVLARLDKTIQDAQQKLLQHHLYKITKELI